MRAIKFRAWDPRFKEYVDKYDNVYIESEGDIYVDTHFDYSICKEDYEIEQFTGLHDKNGVEIYEGDIVIFSMFEGCSPTRWKVTIPNIYIAMHHETEEKLHVIGNIHENPELLDE